MADEIMSPEDLEKEMDPPGGESPSPEEGGDTPAEESKEDSTPTGDVAEPAKETAASGDTATPKPAEEAIPRWRLNEEIQRRKQAEALLQQMATSKPTAPEPPKPKPEDAAPVPPDAKTFTDYDQYMAAREKYIEDKAEWKAKQTTAQEWDRRQQEARTQAEQQSAQDRLAKASRNWDASVAAATTKDPNIQAHIDAGMRIPPLAGVHAMESEDPAALIARIGKTEGMVEKIWAMTPDQQIRTIARLEAEIAQEKKAGNGGPVKKPSATVPALNPARLGNNPSNADIFKSDVPVDVFARGLFPLPKR